MTPAGPPKITAGFVSFTEVTDPAEHRAYNEWHQLDHLPEQFTVPGIGWGERWVATPNAAASHRVARPPFDAAHYVTLYLLAEPVEDTLLDFQALARRLADAGRFHRRRRSVAKGRLDVALTAAAPRTQVAGEAVPYRPNLGLHVRVDELSDHGASGAAVAPGAHAEVLVGWLAAEWVPRALARPGVAGTWVFRPVPAALGGDATPRVLTVSWLDGPVLDVAAGMADQPDAPDELARTVFDGVFERIEPHRWDWFDGPATSPPSKESR